MIYLCGGRVNSFCGALMSRKWVDWKSGRAFEESK